MSGASGGAVVTPAGGTGRHAGTAGWTAATTVVDGLRALRPEQRRVLCEIALRGDGFEAAAERSGLGEEELAGRLHDALRALVTALGGRPRPAAGVHVGVAAYLLGLLDDVEARQFEYHVVTCAGCRRETEALAPAARLLLEARPRVEQPPDGRRLERAMAPRPDVTPPLGMSRPMPAAARHERAPLPGWGRGPAPHPVLEQASPGPFAPPAPVESGFRAAARPRLLLPFAAVALLVAAAVTGGEQLQIVQGGSGGRPAAASGAGAGDPAADASEDVSGYDKAPKASGGAAAKAADKVGGTSTTASGGAAKGASQGSAASVPEPDAAADVVRRAEASSATSGVAAEVEVAAAAGVAGASRVSLSVTTLSGPRSCRLVAVAKGGDAQVLATWQVPAAGFGTTEQPDPFTLAVTAPVAAGDLTVLRIEAVGTGGKAQKLLALKL